MTDKTITARLAAALQAMSNPDTNRDGHHPGSRYVTLDAVLDHVRPVLAEHGLGVSQNANEHGVETVLYDDAGASWSFGTFPVVWGGNPQANGSAVTYARRSALQMAFGIFGETDDDGQAAVPKTRRAPAKRGEITAAQLKRLQATWADVPRDARLAEWGRIIGRPVTTANELTRDEAGKIIEAQP